MVPSESLELAELVADLGRTIDVTAPGPRAVAPTEQGLVLAALDEFEAAWSARGIARDGLAASALQVASAGMALVEGDPQTVRRLLTASPRPSDRP